MIQKNLRAIIVLELLFPLTLLLFGAYHGVLQVLYRAGVIQDTSFLGIGYYTADEYIRAVYEKLEVRSRGSAIAKAVKEKLVPPQE